MRRLVNLARRRANLPDWLTNRPIAHRGLHSAAAPENSLPAFEAARDAGYPIELDVHVLPDGEVIVFHDDDLLRASGVARSLREVSRDSIASYRLFGTPHTIPTLRQVLACVHGRVPILVEIKSRHAPSDAARQVLERLGPYRGELAIQSFDPAKLSWFARHAPRLLRGQLAGPLLHDDVTPFERFASRHLLSLALSRPHFVNYDLRGLPDARVGTVCTLFDLPLLCWTVRSERDRAKAEALGLNYVFDDVRPVPAI